MGLCIIFLYLYVYVVFIFMLAGIGWGGGAFTLDCFISHFFSNSSPKSTQFNYVYTKVSLYIFIYGLLIVRLHMRAVEPPSF